MGILVEGKIAVDINPDIDAGKFDDILKAETIEVSAEKREVLAEQLQTFNKQFAGDLAKIEAAKVAKEAKDAKREASAIKKAE